MTTAWEIVKGSQPERVETADQPGDGIMDFPARRSGGSNQGHPICDCQQGNGSLVVDDGFALSSDDSLQFLAFWFSQRTKGLGNWT
jgi:hypothetical protein